MSQNGISTLSTKQARQEAKLALAQQDRQNAGNPRSTLDSSTLPSLYVGNTVVPNPHPSGLVLGRPWKA